MYLSKLTIQNFRGVKELEVKLNPGVNFFVGPNGSNKTAIIDAIRVFYNFGLQQKDIYINLDDFHYDSREIIFSYEFSNLSPKEKGTFVEALVIPDDGAEEYIKFIFRYQYDSIADKMRFVWSAGEREENKIDTEAFEMFNHYYLSALRDATKDLLTSKNNILGKLLLKKLESSKKTSAFEDLMKSANDSLKAFDDVKATKDTIQKNLLQILKANESFPIELAIENPRVEYLVNILRPILKVPSGRTTELSIKQNSLGFNNLIYISTILGDIDERLNSPTEKDKHYALLVEEPEAHLHPQLQTSLFSFLSNFNKENSQLFITTHSPTLTSQVPLESLIVLSRENRALNLNTCFLAESNGKHPGYKTRDFQKRQLQRYIDVTKSQLLFSSKVLLVEGPSEKILIPSLLKVKDIFLSKEEVEIVNIEGISFYPFLILFNSKEEISRLDSKVSILTDEDRCTLPLLKDIKEDGTGFALIKAWAKQFSETDPKTNRINNIKNFIGPSITKVSLSPVTQTFEFSLFYNNIPETLTELWSSTLFKFLVEELPDDFKGGWLRDYIEKNIPNKLDQQSKYVIAGLFLKVVEDNKPYFAQLLSLYLDENINKPEIKAIVVPPEITNSITHLLGV